MIKFAIPIIVAALFSSASHASCRLELTSNALDLLRDGQEVPTNLALVAPTLRGEDGPLEARSVEDNVTLVEADADDVAILRVERELRPGIAYDICAPSGRCVSVVAGEAADDDPVGAVTASLTKTHGLVELQPECGEPVNATVVVVGADRPAGAVALLMHRQLGDVRSLVRLTPLSSDEPVVNLVDVASEGGRAEYEVAAVDLGGNFSEPTLVSADLGCGGSCSTFGGSLPVGVFGLALLRRRRTSWLAPLERSTFALA